ncbi:MAG: hypothetical protein AAF432_15645, partial [Planctomycetota bacterium]
MTDSPPGKGDLFPNSSKNNDETPHPPVGAGAPTDPNLPDVVQHVDDGQLQHFVTTIKSAEAQVGDHIIQALRADDCVAVLTTVVVGQDGQQRIVSAALDPERMLMVQQALG